MALHSPPLDAVFQALADPTRRAVLARLSEGPASIGDLAAPFDMALPSFLKHIRQLESAGWIVTAKRGRVRTCALRPEAQAQAEGWLSQQRQAWEARTDRLEAFLAQQSEGDTR